MRAAAAMWSSARSYPDAPTRSPRSSAAPADHLANLLGALAADPARSIDGIELVSAEERDWLVEDCNATGHSVDPAATVTSLFEAQVARTPDRVAVEDDAGRSLT